MVTKMLDFIALGIINKILGGLLASLKIAFIISMIFWFFEGNNLTSFVISEEKKENSILYKPIEAIAPLLLPRVIDEFKKVKENFTPNNQEENSQNNTL